MKKVELLSPVGDFECLKAAVQNGADAVYLGASSFNARAKATNFDDEMLLNAISYAKLRNVKVNLTLNILIKNDEFEDAIKLAISAYNAGADALIIQDIGLATYLKEHYPEIPLHASTQMTIHNLSGAIQAKELGFSRCVLSRELSISEIQNIKNNLDLELEVFIHGALCISYSGQCLMSSLIGGRSGNRGMCAQPCRLPYELYSSDDELLDKGYILSPRDLSSIELLPELIKSNVDSFKIEGRMKNPEYVGTVTRIYRKYLDLVYENYEKSNDEIRKLILKEYEKINESTLLSDKQELMQVFNRGEFSTGHLKEEENRNLIFKSKPNNMGIYIGQIEHFNDNQGHITLTLENKLSVGDRIQINSDSYTVSELMIKNKNFTSLEKGQRITIGRMKGNIRNGLKLYKIENVNLNKFITPTFKENKEFKKIPLNAKISIKPSLPISLEILGLVGFYENININVCSEFIPEKALNKPTSKEEIIEQLSKTGNTEFEFKEILVNMNEEVFLPKSILNDLRRIALEKLEKTVIQNNPINKLQYKENYTLPNLNSPLENKKISILLNTISSEINYSFLNKVENVYIPYRLFFNKELENKINEILNSNQNVYIYMPSIIRDTIKINIDYILNKYKIKGFVISHISQIETLKKYNLELIGNYTLNVFSTETLKFLNDNNISKITASPELSEDEINNLSNQTEVIIYGKIPVMTNNYCYLGKSNKCYAECDKKCALNNKYYLQDRYKFRFRVIPDNITQTTTIFNSRETKKDTSVLKTAYYRIDILDETEEEIKSIIEQI